MKNSPEEDLQIAVMDFARLNAGWNAELLTLIHIPNGGFRTAREAGRLKMAGVKSGVSDLHLPPRWEFRKGLWLELKIDKNKPTSDQEKWLRLMADRGQQIAVARSLEGAAAVLSWVLKDARLLKQFPNITWTRGANIASERTVPRKVIHSQLCQGAVEIPCKDFEAFWRWLEKAG
jgi:hypothetical protein